MGLFYNYNKEGPGIKKGGPEKRTFVVFLETLFRNIWKMIPVSFIYCLLFFIPVGFSAVGMTNVTRSLSRDKHTFGVSDFFTAIKKNWKQAISVGIINNIVLALILFNISFFSATEGVAGTFTGIIGLGVSIFIAIVFTVMKFYIWFIVITFDMKLKQIYLNSFKFFIVNLKNNFIMLFGHLLFWAIIILLWYAFPGPIIAAVTGMLLIFFYPVYHYLVIQFGIFSSIKKYMIDPYYAEHPDADIEKRRALGLDVGDKEEPDFQDLI